MPVITVAPVVVKPDSDSNRESIMLICGVVPSAKGSAPDTPSTTQNSTTTKNPSLILSSFLLLRTGNQIISPLTTVIVRAKIKGGVAPSW